ncbi:serine/threonine-protein kinase [Streptomyces litchfieldiae]|uniref:Serine/threonine-protein kinase n=1 Tax=Streptomyces litchfieldiae TaxID=3075543 RepID=A0ABU2MMD4_9ACTN|nr:serine/threonine-protein kinase [Streptomyces sp. DSM 44938]MDT0341814.1 serine/threonine-protein kinase [Streptomyces sp. DSM 44938]
MEALTPQDPPRIGPYRLIGRLGEGGMGVVYLARSDRGRMVAVKTIIGELAREPDFRRRFDREITAARRVGGQWTAPVFDADPEAEPPWVATRYIPGFSLFELVNRYGPLPERSLLLLAGGMAQALKAIHEAGVLHRDLKPSNVLVTFDGPRVIDFGIARALDPAPGEGITRTGTTIGSPGFMSPEQVRGERLTPASDVFGLGSLLAYAATGRTPFGAVDSAPHLLTYRIVEEPPDLDGVPEKLRTLISGCLAKDPARRTPVAELLNHPAPGDAGVGDGGPWLPAAIVERLGRVAATLLESENPRTLVGEPETVRMEEPPIPAPAPAPAPYAPPAPAAPAPAPAPASFGPPAYGGSPPHAPQPAPAAPRRGLFLGLAGVAVAAVLGIVAVVALTGGDGDGDDPGGGGTTPPPDLQPVAEGHLGAWQGEFGTEGEPGWRGLWFEIREGTEGESVGTAFTTYMGSMCVYDMRLESFQDNRLSYTEVAERSVPEGEIHENCRADGTVKTLELQDNGDMRWTDGDRQTTLEAATADGGNAVPASLVGSWRDEYRTGEGEEGLDEVTVEQGAVGDTVVRWSWTLDGETCVWDYQLAGVSGDRVLLSPEILIAERSDDTCDEDDSSWAWAGADGTLYFRWTSRPDDSPYAVYTE